MLLTKFIILQYGSAVKFPGSGGAVIGLCLDKLKKVGRYLYHPFITCLAIATMYFL